MKKFIASAIMLVLFVYTSAQLSPGVYKIRNAANGKYLRAGNMSGDNSTVFQFDFTDDNYFKWRVEAAGKYLSIINIQTNKKLAVSGNSVTNGAALIVQEGIKMLSSGWQILTVSSTTGARDGQYTIRNVNSNKIAVVEGSSRENGARIVIRDDAAKADMVWEFEPTIPSAPSEVVVAKNQWVAALTPVLATLSMKINNFSVRGSNPDKTYKWLLQNDCSFSIGTGDYVIARTYDLPALRMEPATVYFIDIRALGATVEPDFNTIRFTIQPEETSQEILANCIDNIICGINGMWWAHLSNMRIHVLMRPVIERGRLTYQSAMVRVNAVASSQGDNAFMANLNYNSIYQKAARAFEGILNNPEMKEALTAGLNANLSRLAPSLPNPLTSVTVSPTGSLIFR